MAQIQRLKKATTVVATFLVALTIGFVMQYGDADASRVMSAKDEIGGPAPLDPSPLRRTSAMIPKIAIAEQAASATDRAVRVDPETIKLAALVANAEDTDRSATFFDSPTGVARDCPITVAAQPIQNAMVNLSIYSGCRANMTLNVYHAGLVVSAKSSGAGHAGLTLPAMKEDAAYQVSFSDGGSSDISVNVPEARDFKRLVLQWRGTPGHFLNVAAQTARDSTGTIERLGLSQTPSAHFAEVYSVSANTKTSDMLAQLDARAAITENTCDQSLIAQSFFVFPDADADPKDIRITLPGCEQVGSFLELKKVLGAQTILQ